MKKLLFFILTLALVISSFTVAYAKPSTHGNQNKKQTVQQEVNNKKTSDNKKTDTENDKKVTDNKVTNKKTDVTQSKGKENNGKQNGKVKEKKQTFKINGSPVIKYGKYKLPIKPVTQGMGATVAFDKATAVLTVTKGTTTIVIDFINKTSTVNGVVDANSSIFTSSNSKKSTVLIKYIANKLGVRVNVEDDKITVTVPGLDLPTKVTVTPVGTTVVANTLNSSSLYLTATANIVAGQATGGKAELYVGSTLVATDAQILATDTTVIFTTADATPLNSELQALIPAGGVVTVKLYNASNQSVTSSVANPTLVVDYVVPTVTGISSAVYNVSGSAINVSGSAISVSGSAITINVTGASAVNDKVDVSKISLYDYALNKYVQLTSSTGVVSSATTLTINVSAADYLALAGFGSSSMVLTVAPGSLIVDSAGNTSVAFTSAIAIPLTLH